MLANLVIAKKAAAATATAEAKARKEKAKSSSTHGQKETVTGAMVPEVKRGSDTAFAADGWTSEGRRDDGWGDGRGAGGKDDLGAGKPKQR